jgi:ABC-type antimicrobial peptide transport system permease subunit
MLLLGIFAAVAVVLAMVGVHGMLSYMVARRTPEMGIRMALGATRANVSGLVVRYGARLAGLGLAIGIAAALGTTHLLRRLLFGISSVDPITFAAVAALVFGVTLLATWIPALRATRADPMEALRHE